MESASNNGRLEAEERLQEGPTSWGKKIKNLPEQGPALVPEPRAMQSACRSHLRHLDD